jgi:hypothetical protein
MGNGGDHTLLRVIVVIINNILKNMIKNAIKNIVGACCSRTGYSVNLMHNSYGN